MGKIKVIDTLSVFDKKQIGQLSKFIASPYFNKNYNSSEVKELLEILISKSSKELDKRDLQEHFFPNKPFQENSKNAIDNLLTDLNSLVEEFIVIEELAPLIKAKSAWAKASFFAKVGKEDRLWPIVASYRKKWKKNPVKDFKQFQYRFEIEELATEFRGVFKSQNKESGLAVTNEYLDKFFLGQKAQLAFIYEFERRMHGGKQTEEREDGLWLYLMENYQAFPEIHTPISNSYFQAYKVTVDMDSLEKLDHFERMLEEYESMLPEADLRNLYVVYRAYRGRQYQRLGKADLIPSFLGMYKKHLAKGLLTVKGKLFASTLKVLVGFGTVAEDFEWVSNLLKDFPPRKIIGTRYPKEFHRLCLAELYFAEKKYEEAEAEITYRLFENFTYSLSCDILLVKIYFETQNDLLESRLRAMELKVRRAKIKDFDKQSYLAFISIVRKLDKYLWLKDEKKIAKIEQDIQSDKPLIQREWLNKCIKDKAHNLAN